MQKSDVDTHFRTVLMIWGAFLVGVILLTAAAWALSAGLLVPWTPSMEAGVVKNLLAAPVLLMAAGIFYRRGDMERSDHADAHVQRYGNRVVIASAMQEAGGLMGLVLCLLAGMSTWVVAMGGLSALSMLMSRPHRSDLDHLGA